MRRRGLPTLLTILSAVLALAASLARADVAPPRPLLVLTVREVRVVESHAPAEDRDRAIVEVHRAMAGFLERVDRCMRDQGPTSSRADHAVGRAHASPRSCPRSRCAPRRAATSRSTS